MLVLEGWALRVWESTWVPIVQHRDPQACLKSTVAIPNGSILLKLIRPANLDKWMELFPAAKLIFLHGIVLCCISVSSYSELPPRSLAWHDFALGVMPTISFGHSLTHFLWYYILNDNQNSKYYWVFMLQYKSTVILISEGFFVSDCRCIHGARCH